MKEDLDTRVEASVGPIQTGWMSMPGRIRKFYTQNYKALDQFDQLWYECCYDKRDISWETRYTWALILDCVLNAHSAYCESTHSIEPLRTFIGHLIIEIQERTCQK